ncbi:hypothetical protein AX774_g6300 [Zancudomyces culisetae]|uniref:Uncharacterized protein n=1 Tax=Zancudomyces culisetae TaxID=1213189 RepID=A0A1R1PH12_ZANCU|nr:hypothetical protein AX774_g6300 [Zancudomyces culisetae]|eukprot:OMH80266.1 hypothetical protein AX774_g6300 [Zancudomyces culisetae]
MYQVTKKSRDHIPSYSWCSEKLRTLPKKYERLADKKTVKPVLAEAMLNCFRIKLIETVEACTIGSSSDSEDEWISEDNRYTLGNQEPALKIRFNDGRKYIEEKIVEGPVLEKESEPLNHGIRDVFQYYPGDDCISLPELKYTSSDVSQVNSLPTISTITDGFTFPIPLPHNRKKSSSPRHSNHRRKIHLKDLIHSTESCDFSLYGKRPSDPFNFLLPSDEQPTKRIRFL